MSDISTDQYEDYEQPLQEIDFVETFQPSSGGIRREKKIPVNEMNVDVGMKLNAFRTAMHELISAQLTTGAGWYTVAKSSRGINRTMSASFTVGDFGNESGILPFDVVFANSSITKTHSNTGITLRPRGTFSNTLFGIKNARVAKSDSVDDAGCLIQVELTDASSVNKITTLMDKNTANVISELGFTLVEPVLDNTPTLPDGVTSGGSVTFLEATESKDSRTVYDISDASNQVHDLPDTTQVLNEQIIKRRGSGSGKVTFTTVSSQTIEGLSASTWELEGEGIIVLFPSSGNWEVKIFNDYPVGENTLQDQLQIAKAWVNFNGTGTIAINNDFNVSSLTDNGVGDHTINFTNNLADVNYSVVGNGAAGVLVSENGAGGSKAVGSYRITVSVGSTGAQFDSSTISIQIFGL